MQRTVKGGYVGAAIRCTLSSGAFSFRGIRYSRGSNLRSQLAHSTNSGIFRVIQNLLTLDSEDRQVAIWNVRPFPLVSLLEMLEHNANIFYFTTHQLQRLQRQITNAIDERGGSDLPTKLEADKTRRLLKRIEREAEKLKFSRVLERLDNFEDDPLLQPLVGNRFTLELLRRELKEVDREIARALGQNKFMMIPANEARYYNNLELFGSEVAARFSDEASKEIVEAGNCYATGSDTACVFHLMRTVEYGVRTLVTTFKIKFKNKPRLTIEFRQWGEILGAIQGKILEVEKRKKTRLRDETLEFLRDAYMQFRHLKDKWRNHVMHTRDSYDANDARKTMQYVEEFMQHLATRLKER